MATTPAKRACSVCGTLLADDSPFCPACALRGAVETPRDSVSDTSSELRFEHYQVLRNQDGKPLELGPGGMGVTCKAIDTHLGCPVALKIISAQLLGNESARSRFLREARAAASVHHPNVATVHHLGESGGNCFYAMEFVDGETLENLIRRRGRLEIEPALEITSQVTAGLNAIHKQHLVHRDIKPSNIMLSWEEGRLENVKIIDLGLAQIASVHRYLHTQEVAGSNPASRTMLPLRPLEKAMLLHGFRRLKAILYALLSLDINVKSRVMRYGSTAPPTVPSSPSKNPLPRQKLEGCRLYRRET